MRDSTDWMDLEKHHELKWIKEVTGSYQERKRTSRHHTIITHIDTVYRAE